MGEIGVESMGELSMSDLGKTVGGEYISSDMEEIGLHHNFAWGVVVTDSVWFE